MIASPALLSLMIVPLLLSAFAMPTATSGQIEVAPGESADLPLDLSNNANLVYIVSVSSGGSIDVLLMDAQNYSLFTNGQPYSTLPVSRNDTSSAHQECTLTKGEYHLVIKNNVQKPQEVFYEYQLVYDIIGGLTPKMAVATAITAMIIILAAVLYLPRYLRR